MIKFNKHQIIGYVIMCISALGMYIIYKNHIRYNVGYISIIMMIIGFYITIYYNDNIDIRLKEA